MLRLTLIALFALSARALNVLDKNYELDMDTLTKNDNFYNGLETLLGTGQEKSQDKATFEINLGYPYTFIGDKNKSKWGIDCSNPDNNSCQITDTTEDLFFYYSKQLNFQTGAMFLRADKNNNLNITDPVVDKLGVRIVTGGNNWVLNDWGVIGLAPQGAFAKYFTAVYGKSSSLLLLFNAKDKNAENESFKYDVRTFINVFYNETAIVKNIEIPETSNSWSAVATMNFISTEWSFTNAPICFNTMTPEIIQVPDSTDRCDAVKNLICAGKIGPLCTKDIADFTTAQKLVIQIGDSNFEFAPEEYLYYTEKNIVDCRFGDVEDLRTNESCDSRTEFALGRMFFQKYIPVLQFNFGQKANLILLNQFSAPIKPDGPSGSWLWIIIGILVSMLVIGAIVAFIMKKKRGDEEAYYANYETAHTATN